MKTARPLATRVLPPLLLAALVAVTAAIPLIANRWFYYWDDSAAAFAPGWAVIGEKLLAGTWPTIVPEMWAGGNITAEALYGLYNPVLLAGSIFIASVPNMAIGLTLIKLAFLTILAVGTYILARQFGATKPMAFIAGYALPFAGYTLYFDASSWASGLFAFAWIPHVFWSVRGTAAGRVNPLIAVIFSALALTTGNPYGAVAVAVVYLSVGVEYLLTSRRGRIGRIFVAGGASLLLSLIVYLPLAFTTGVSVRTQSGVSNNGMLAPGLGDVLDMSNPSRLPMISSFGAEFMTMPVGYLAWFIVPLIPWIRWRTLRSSCATLSSLVTFFGIYVALLLGPSQLWLFRWPLRLLEYAQLPVIVAFAVALSAGMARNHIRVRVGATASLLVTQFYSAWSSVPQDIGYHAIALATASVLAFTAVFLWRRSSVTMVGALAVGVSAFLALQTTAWFPGNYNVTPWLFPRQASFVEDRMENRYIGNTFAIADPENIPLDAPASQWGAVIFGNQWQAAGVQAVNSYAGVSFADFVETLCLNYYGGVTCPDALERLQRDAPGTDVSWIDALRLETIVVQNSGPYGGPRALDALPESDWAVTTDGPVTIGRRIRGLPWPNGRLSALGDGVAVISDVTDSDTRESLRYTGSGTATFALLAWPGWTATVDGQSVDVDPTDGGLLQVNLPDGGREAVIEYSPPGQSVGIAFAAAGLVLALGQALAVGLVDRRRRSVAPDRSDQSDAVDVT
ncbi:hypothetical protein HQ305_20990 [Rhodococcus sp. BP-149]|uniref:hypothetical protein n=1 Tax=unclassified Rhodococcus (in: high G+C Gram-positive bacteria) TaxID=192944 RepID=UPI001C9A9B42|nr:MULTISPECIES: hypothetical protein [unclassified Rhodococcus (in: high G+C Gram-positive bacteria)]MBY6687705.1 hypothetical protein [Rhodococcus sp. BP-288]MBY6695860.1 hypothetical protein [Rhodococcus sp. BP-188]MBY6700332.1 hypothetical protein [Rhodococcus sp. BP-285]MBY6704645.1 hypothetical protein [Rhodococcus sp. BP-283]MBY6713457.1 hypothetical protein [Rhodococcus sp. BP-160]